MKQAKKLKLWDIFCLATGAMISSGLFVLPAIAYRYSGPSIIFAYFVAGLLMIPSILSKSELLTAMPKAGGTYFFIERSFGPFLGIFGGLASWFSLSLKSAFALVGIGTLLEYALPSLGNTQLYFFIKLVAASFCVIFVLINIFSLSLGSRVQNIMVTFLLLVCIAYIIFGMKNLNFSNFQPLIPRGIWPFFSVVGLVFVSYGGLTKVAALSEETKNPSRTIPLGMFLSFIVVQVIYILCVAVTIGVLDRGGLMATFTPLAQGAVQLGGVIFGAIISLAALTAFISTANAGILSSSRVPYAMAKDNLLGQRLALVSKKFGTPYIAIILTGLFMLFLILFLDLENLVKTASTLMVILFIFVNLSVIMMRESRIINYRPTFRSPLYPWLQIFALVTYGFLIFNMGLIPLSISVGFVLVSLIWFGFSARSIKRQSALMHIVERVTAKEFVDTSLEDELKEILHKRDNVIKDRFDHLIEKCPVLDLQGSMTRDDFFTIASEILGSRLNIDHKKIKDLLLERERQSTTVIEKGLALPHIVVEAREKFEILIVRSKQGVVFSPDKEPVHIVFVLAGSKDERNFHLRALMAIAQIVREHNFYKNWLRMRDEESLRMLVLSSTRKRDI